MSVHVVTILGRADEPRFADRRVVRVAVAWDEASRRRLRRVANDGTDVTIDLADGSYLADGAVLDDDGERILAVSRLLEPVLVIRFDPRGSLEKVAGQALRVGHAFGNQHVPIEVEDGEARVPLTTSEQVTRATVEALRLDGVTVEVAEVALGAERPLPVGHPREVRQHLHGSHVHDNSDGES